MKEQYYQGDVLFVKREGRFSPPRVWSDSAGQYISETPIAPANGKHIIARGEKTGHTHTVDSSAVDLFQGATGLVAIVKQPTWVVHDEHPPIQLPEGEYDIVIQRQYVPEAVPRKVWD